MLSTIKPCIINHIKDMLWGNTSTWKTLFSQIIKPFTIENDLISYLKDIRHYCADYCPSCGEKEVYSSISSICDLCKTPIHKYPFNTFSGGNQGCFYLHNVHMIYLDRCCCPCTRKLFLRTKCNMR